MKAVYGKATAEARPATDGADRDKLDPWAWRRGRQVSAHLFMFVVNGISSVCLP